jgi:hypothetical protein
MGDAKAKWDDVGDRFNDIAEKMKGHYEQPAVNDALRQFVDTLDAGFTALGDALRDPAVRDDLKGAGVAFGDAIAATFDTVAEEIRKAVRK